MRSGAIGGGSPRVLASILHYNAPALAVETIRCFQNQSYPCLELQVLDNASSPEAVGELKRLCPAADVRLTGANLGYTGGNNQALRRGIREGFDHVIVSNEDIEIEPSAVANLVDTAHAHPDAGVVGAVEIAHRTGQTRVARGVGFSLWTGRERWLSNLDEAKGPAEPVDFVQGAMVMFTRAALEAGVLFDEALFIYYDEIDLGLALKRAGLRAYLDHRVVVSHKNDPLSFNPRSAYLSQRNRVYLVRKYGRWFHRLFFQLYVAGVELPWRVVVRSAQGHGRFARACVLGHVDGVLGRMGRGRLGQV